jgi:hypothetical protein
MVARSGVIFPASMAANLANPMEIYFGPFTVISPVLAPATSPVVVGQVAAVPVTTTVSNPMTETHIPKPYDLVRE